MRFTKMHGAGNDYVYVNAFEESVADPVELAIRVSHRHFGIGADGLILIKPHPTADAEMEMYNADGSRSEMCGNGLRCVAKFVFDHDIAPRKQLNLMTGAGLKQAEVVSTDAEGKADLLSLEMGQPFLTPAEIPTTLPGEPPVLVPLEILDTTFEVTCVGMGNPHCIVYVEDVASFPVEKYGPLLENHEAFPRRTNVEFVQVVGPHEVIQRTWERGSGETWACGTGASAVCVAGVLTGKTQGDLLIHLLGGDLQLSWQPGESVRLTGGAVEVFSGEITE